MKRCGAVPLWLDLRVVSERSETMNPKLLILLAWVFYLLERRTSDTIWLFCMVFSCVLAVCAYFFKREDRGDQSVKKTKES